MTELGSIARLTRTTAMLAIVIVTTTVHAAGTSISLSEGSDIIVSVHEDEFAMQLAGRIWTFSSANSVATPLTDLAAFSRQPALSRDASRIAFESVRDGFHQIIVMQVDGTDSRQVTFGDYNHRTPRWSPVSDTRLVIASDRAGDFGLWELDLESLALRQLTFRKGDELEPTWTSDGSKLAFVSPKKTGTAIYAVEPGGEPTQLLFENNQIRAPSWRPDGGTLTYVRDDGDRSQLRMLILSDPSVTKPITRNENVHPGPTQWIDRENFFYAADGRIKQRQFGLPATTEVPFTARVEVTDTPYSRSRVDFAETDNRPVRGIAGISPTPQGTQIIATLSDLWEFDVADNGDRHLLRQLTNDAFVDTHPTVSPDGLMLAFVSDRDGSPQVWVLDLDTLRRRRVTSEPGMAIRPAWDPESKSIAFLAAGNTASASLTLKQLTISDRQVRVLTEDITNPAVPVWDESSETFSAPDTPDQEDARAAAALEVPVPLSWRPFEPDGSLVIRAGRIFDGIGPGYLTEHEIVIHGNRIAEIRPWSDTQDSVPVIDAHDKTVVPGFIDLSVRQTTFIGEQVGRAWLAYGITTVRESVFDFAESVERQESWSSGRRVGPRMLLSLNLCNLDVAALEANRLPAPTSKSDVAQIEFCASLRGESLKNAISAAHDNGLPVATVAPFPGILLGADEFQLAPAAGSDGRAMTSYDVATLAGMSGKTVLSRLSVAGLPGMSERSRLTSENKYLRLFSTADRNWYENLWNQERSSDRLALRPPARKIGQTLFRAIATGARAAVGSDAPASPYGLGLHAELQLLTGTGLQPFQVLKMASLDAARLIGAGEQIGSIHAGKLADLVIIDGDPLANIADSANIVITIVNGRVYTLDELLSRGGRANSVGKFYN